MSVSAVHVQTRRSRPIGVPADSGHSSVLQSKTLPCDWEYQCLLMGAPLKIVYKGPGDEKYAESKCRTNRWVSVVSIHMYIYIYSCRIKYI